MAEEAAKTTTGGAGLVQTNAYLTAAAVMIYTTRAIWLKLRKMLAADYKENKDQELRKMKFIKQKESESSVAKVKDEEPQEEYDGQPSAAQVPSQIIDVYPG